MIPNIQNEDEVEDAADVGELQRIVGGAPASEPIDWQPLAQQISQQWKSYGLNPEIKGINRANELAQILSNYGITDLSKIGITETPYEEMVNAVTGEGGQDSWSTVTRNRGQLTYGDQKFGRLGGFGSGGEREFSAPQEYLQQSDPGRYGLGYSAAGKGWTEFEVVKDASGKAVIVPKWGSSSDLDPGLIQVLALAGNFLAPGISSALASTLGATGANIATKALISGTLGGAGAAAQGGSFGKGFGKGAVAGGLGAAAGPYLGQLGSEASKIVGGGNIGNLVSSAVQGAGRGAVGAVITGDSVLDAILTGAAGGAASAGTDMLVKGTNSTLNEYLKDVPGPIKNAVLSAASAGILGKDIGKAAINSFIGSLMKDLPSSTGGRKLADVTGADAIEGFFAPGGEGYDATQDDINSILARYQDTSTTPTSTTSAFTPGSDDVYEDIENLLARYENQGFADTPSGATDQSIDITGEREGTIIPDWDILPDVVTTPRSIRDIGTVTKIAPGEKLEGTEIKEPDLAAGLKPAVTGGTKPGATKPASSGPNLDSLMKALMLMQQRPQEQKEQYQLANMPDYEDLMYGLSSGEMPYMRG